MKVEVIHPIDYNNVYYGRGVHDLPEEVGKFFVEQLPHAARPFVLAEPAKGEARPSKKASTTENAESAEKKKSKD